MPNVAELNQIVSDRIKSSSEVIQNRLIEKFVSDEITRRADLLTKLVVALNNLRKEAGKIRADLTSYDEKGQAVSVHWSKKQLDSRQKIDQKIAKGEKTFDDALNSNDYGKVEQVIKELETKPDPKKVAEETPAEDATA